MKKPTVTTKVVSFAHGSSQIGHVYTSTILQVDVEQNTA